MNTFDLDVQVSGFYCIDAKSKEEAKEHVVEMCERVKKDVEDALGTTIIRIEATDVLESQGGTPYGSGDETVYPFDAHFLLHAVMKETASEKEEAEEILMTKLMDKLVSVEEALLIGAGILVNGREVE